MARRESFDSGHGKAAHAFGWEETDYDTYGSHKEGSSYWHSSGPQGFGIDLPSGRDYGAVVESRLHSLARLSSWDNKIESVHEYSGISDAADSISDAMDFMDVTDTNEVTFDKEEKESAGIGEHDLLKNLHEKRPNFPKRFYSADRAKYVAQLLVLRRDANIPLTPRPRVNP